MIDVLFRFVYQFKFYFFDERRFSFYFRLDLVDGEEEFLCDNFLLIFIIVLLNVNFDGYIFMFYVFYISIGDF